MARAACAASYHPVAPQRGYLVVGYAQNLAQNPLGVFAQKGWGNGGRFRAVYLDWVADYRILAPIGVLDVDCHAPRAQVGVLQNLRRVLHRAGGDSQLGENLRRLMLGYGSRPRAHYGLHLVGAGGARFGGVVARVAYQVGASGEREYRIPGVAGDAWDSILALAGRADLIGDPRYDAPESRAARADEVESIVSAWTRTVTKHEAAQILTELGIPAGAVQDTAEILQDPHLRARRMAIDVQDPNRGEYPIIGNPIKIDGAEAPPIPPPLLGEHTERILGEILGVSDDEIASLRRDGVI